MLERVPISVDIGVKNLRRRKLRSFLTLIGIISAVLAFVVVASITKELSEWTLKADSKTTNHGLLMKFKYEKIYTRGVGEKDITVWIDEELVSKIESMEGIDYVLKEFKWAKEIPIFLMDGKGVYGVYGVDSKEIDRYHELKKILVDGELSGDGIVIPENYATQMNVKVGDFVTLSSEHYSVGLEVTGIFNPALLQKTKDLKGDPATPKIVSLVGGEHYYPEKTVITSVEVAKKLLNQENHYTNLLIFPEQKENLSELAKKILPLTQVKGGRLSLILIEVNHGIITYHTAYKTVKFARIGSIIIVVIISALTILNTMLAAIYERVKEIGTLSSVGANPTHIGKLFLVESSILGIFGGFLGYIFGIGVLYFGKIFQGLSQKLSISWFLAAILLSTLMAILSSLYPASKASWLVVPSLRRSWKPSSREILRGEFKVEEDEQPIVLAKNEFEDFIHYIKEKMDRPIFYDLDNFYGRVEEKEEEVVKVFGFLATPIGAPVKADVEIKGRWRKREKLGKVYLTVKPWLTQSMGHFTGDSGGLQKYAYDIAGEIREVILQWRVQKKKFRVLRKKQDKT